jgi:hypothetical protein
MLPSVEVDVQEEKVREKNLSSQLDGRRGLRRLVPTGSPAPQAHDKWIQWFKTVPVPSVR